MVGWCSLAEVEGYVRCDSPWESSPSWMTLKLLAGRRFLVLTLTDLLLSAVAFTSNMSMVSYRLDLIITDQVKRIVPGHRV